MSTSKAAPATSTAAGSSTHPGCGPAPGDRLGLVLSGGAARGAYEAGVLRYVFCDLAPRLGWTPWPCAISGTSVGALNGVFVAARQARHVARLSRIWQEMRISDVYKLPDGGLVQIARDLLWPKQESAFLDASPLANLIRQQAPMAAARRALDAAETGAFIVAATDLADGNNTLFVHSSARELNWQIMPGTRLIRMKLSRQHLMASAALPLLFPPVRLADHLYVDGALRQNTPLRPTLLAGATRVLVISLQASSGTIAQKPLDHAVPSLPFLIGKSLNALLLDPVARDVHRSEQINRIIEWGVQRYGPDFATSLAKDLRVRHVHLLNLRPRLDIGRLAAETFRSAPPPVDRRLAWMLNQIADRANDGEGESDLLSYLLFDRAYTGELERLGWEDARDQEEALVAFFCGASDAIKPTVS